jgi:CheY-like chemotaxis protein
MGLIKKCVNRTRHWFRKRTVLNKIRVLVFDEDAGDCEFLRSALLQESGAFVDETQSVESALEMHRRTPYHVILAAIPTGSWAAYELLKAIQETDKEYRGFTPVVAVSELASSKDKQRAVDAGFDAYITRPFGASDVINTIVQVLNDAAKRAA